MRDPSPEVITVIPIIAVPLSGVSPPPKVGVVNDVSAEPDIRTLPSAIYPYNPGESCFPNAINLPSPLHAFVALA